MKSARHQLILLGFICQGLTWSDYLLPVVYALLWFACLTVPRRPIRVPALGECGLLAAGSAVGYLLGQMPGQSPHFFIGHGIVWLQAARMLRPLDRREKLFSILAACIHVGVGCTTILDLRFAAILIASIVLFPRVLFELEWESFPVLPNGWQNRLGMVVYSTVSVVTIAFFLVFPRGFLGSPIQVRKAGSQSDGSLVDFVLDPTRGGMAQSRKVILQIEGKRVEALRCLALVDFDGRRWAPDKKAERRPLARPSESDSDPGSGPDRSRWLHRRVRVKHVAFLGGVIPTDRRVQELDGDFFRSPLRNTHGIIECRTMFNTPKNFYEYWVDPSPVAEPLDPVLRKRLLAHPKPSERVRAWLEERVAGIGDLPSQARALEAYLQENFEYTLGAPELNRVNHIEDFLFEQRAGHCERFASTHALLLRMRGIPARVVVGYLSSGHNWLSGWQTVRFRDAHAWTEAYFDDIGWVHFDATPRSQMTFADSYFRDLLDALDVAWHMHVVNFDGGAQHNIAGATIESVGRVYRWIKPHGIVIVECLFLVLLIAAWVNYRRARRQLESPGDVPDESGSPFRRERIQIQRDYDQLLVLLEAAGCRRRAFQTPHEFAGKLPDRLKDCREPVDFITNAFCRTRYGHHPVGAEQRHRVRSALERVARRIEAGEGGPESVRDGSIERGRYANPARGESDVTPG